MKYRCLSDNELKELEEEFKHFLITNNVYTEEWEKLNKEKSDRVKLLIEMFSDIVLDKALKNIHFLEHSTKKDIKCFRCDNEKMILIGITSKNPTIDFTKDTLSNFYTDLDIFKTEKGYYKSRESEVFNFGPVSIQFLKIRFIVREISKEKKKSFVYSVQKKQGMHIRLKHFPSNYFTSLSAHGSFYYIPTKI